MSGELRHRAVGLQNGCGYGNPGGTAAMSAWSHYVNFDFYLFLNTLLF